MQISRANPWVWTVYVKHIQRRSRDFDCADHSTFSSLRTCQALLALVTSPENSDFCSQIFWIRARLKDLLLTLRFVSPADHSR